MIYFKKMFICYWLLEEEGGFIISMLDLFVGCFGWGYFLVSIFLYLGV